jgi:glycosyltransferase involved in cell wall biosynthesis
MKIAHFAPYAPFACGLYEAARDFVHADIVAGNEAFLVDTGAVVNGVRQAPRVGEKDDRKEFSLVAHSYTDAFKADVIVMHDGIGEGFLAQIQTPIILIVHGRPVECFRPEYKNRSSNAYSFVTNASRWPRVKRVVTMWPRFRPFWAPVVSEDKLLVIAPPPIDENLFNPNGPIHLIPPNIKGSFNVLIADSWREVDPYDVIHGTFLAAKSIPGLKVHVYAVEQQKDKTLGAWEHLFAYMRKLGIQGEVFARVPNMSDIYRSMDCVLTPHSIVTRIIGEALCCGTPVISGTPCEYGQWNCIPDVAESVAEAIVRASTEAKSVSAKVQEIASAFKLERFGRAMDVVYQEAVK